MKCKKHNIKMRKRAVYRDCICGKIEYFERYCPECDKKEKLKMGYKIIPNPRKKIYRLYRKYRLSYLLAIINYQIRETLYKYHSLKEKIKYRIDKKQCKNCKYFNFDNRICKYKPPMVKSNIIGEKYIFSDDQYMVAKTINIKLERPEKINCREANKHNNCKYYKRNWNIII